MFDKVGSHVVCTLYGASLIWVTTMPKSFMGPGRVKIKPIVQGESTTVGGIVLPKTEHRSHVRTGRGVVLDCSPIFCNHQGFLCVSDREVRALGECGWPLPKGAVVEYACTMPHESEVDCDYIKSEDILSVTLQESKGAKQ